MDGIYLCFVNKHHSSWALLGLNFLFNDKIIDLPKVKAIADVKINVGQKLKIFYGNVENIVGKREKILVTTMFSKGSFCRVFNPLLIDTHFDTSTTDR